MNVLHVSTPVTWRGGEQQVAYLASALVQLGESCTVICPENSMLSERLNGSGVQVRHFTKRGLFFSSLAKQISSTANTGRFDILHAHDSHAHTAVVMAAAFFGLEIPVIVSRRVDFPVSKTLFSKWKYNHSSIRRIICVSDAIREITASAIATKDKLVVVHDGIDLQRYTKVLPVDLRKELCLAADTKLIGNFSALADHKDYPTFIATAAAVIKEFPKIHFVIAGTGPLENDIRNQILAANLNANIHLLGFRNDVPAILNSLDVFLMTSKTEGLGSILLEAFAAGVPVVTTAAGGIPELVEQGVNGWLAPVGDFQALKEGLILLLNDQALRTKCTVNAMQKVQGFSVMHTAEKTRAIYRTSLVD